MSSGVVILDGLVLSTPTTCYIPHAGVLPRSRCCMFSPSSVHHRRCGRRRHHRLVADVPSLSRGRCTAVAHFATLLLLSR
jgi:hypothetical protein